MLKLDSNWSANYTFSMDNTVIFALCSRVMENGNRLIMSELEKNGLQGIAPSHGDIFIELFRDDGCSMGDLAGHIHRTKSTVTALVDKLERLGYVYREKSADDARGTNVYLTPQGWEMQAAFQCISAELLRLASNRLTDSEIQQLEELLQKLLSE